jgi:hypothetical protein
MWQPRSDLAGAKEKGDTDFTNIRINPISESRIIVCAGWVHSLRTKPGHLALAIDWRIPMKSMILVALAVLSLGVGNAYAQGKPLAPTRAFTARSPKTKAQP